MGTHVNPNLKLKIQEGQYVDLSRLLPRDKIRTEDDHRLEMINKGGLTYWIPLAEKDLSPINSYIKWEQAFRVYMDIYARANPDRITELLQYHHVIEVAVSNYHWDNVYQYDREFRIHTSENPERNWGIILQQAWSLYLKNQISQNNGGPSPRSVSQNSGSNREFHKKTCFMYNRGKCTYGFCCKFEHRCGICGKTGHGAYNCRKAMDYKDRKDRDFREMEKDRTNGKRDHHRK